jgi:hypothetical protein
LALFQISPFNKINYDKDNTMSSIKITQAVGLGGANNFNDVKAVQTALNKLLKSILPTKSLIVDGRFKVKHSTWYVQMAKLT